MPYFVWQGYARKALKVLFFFYYITMFILHKKWVILTKNPRLQNLK